MIDEVLVTQTKFLESSGDCTFTFRATILLFLFLFFGYFRGNKIKLEMHNFPNLTKLYIHLTQDQFQITHGEK